MSSHWSGPLGLPAAAAGLVAGLLGCSDIPTVVEREPSAVLIEPAIVELDPGDQQTLRLVVLDGSGRRLTRLPTGMAVFWETEDPTVAWVDETGTVTGRLPGETGVVARVVYRNQAGSFGTSASLAGGPPPHARARTKVRDGQITIEAVGSTERQGVAGELVVDSPTVRVMNRNGRPVSGVPMRFSAKQGELTQSVVETDREGMARTGWRLGPQPGTQEMGAYVPELETDTVEFQAAATGGPTEIVVSSGASQTGVVGQALSSPLAVRVTDDTGQTVANATVTWQADQGSVSPTWSLTDENGVATTSWTLGATSGGQSATAAVGSLAPIVFTATAAAAELAQLVKVSGDGQTASAGSTLPQPLVVRAADMYGNAVAGVAVGWSTATTGAGTLTVESPTTNAQGIARAAWTLGSTEGQHFVRATAPNVQEAMFGATVAVSSTVARIEIQPAGPISFTSVGDTMRLNVQGYTASGTPVSAGSLNWTSGNTSVVEVNVLGTLLAKGAGTALVVARLAAGTAADTVSVTVTPTVASITVTPSSASVQVGGTVQLTAQPKDAAGNSVQATVTWSSSATSTATVNSSGLVAGVAAGSATITASVGSVKRDVALTVTSTSGGGGGGSTGPSPAELPRVYINTTYSAPTGQTIRVPAGGDLQQAIDNASRGDRILLAPGATYDKITLRSKSGSGWIYIETETSLPGQGTRVGPGSASFAKIQTTNVEPAIRAGSGVSHYRFVGVEVRASTAMDFTYMLVELQPGSSHITFDRVYIHGHSNLSFQRCITANAAHFAVVDSYLSECHGDGTDAQAVGAWDTPGPMKVVNNYLEGAAENFLLGGADPRVTGATPSDIEFRRNHVRKPPEWQGSRWQVKYLFELKHAQRILIEDNVFENSFDGADAGWAFVMKSTNQEGTCGQCKTQDVTVRYNRFINVRHGINLLGRENYTSGPNPQQAARFYIGQNVFESSEPGIAFQILSGMGEMVIERNTIDPGHQIIMFDGAPSGPLVIRNNLFGHSTYGVFGGGVGSGTGALETYAPGYTFTGNGLVGYPAGEYPSGNTILSSMSAATAGMGADVATIYSRTSGVRN